MKCIFHFYFKEDYPELHFIATGSPLEFTLEEQPSFAVGRIRSLYMYPFSFGEFFMARGLDLTIDFKKKATREESLLQDGIHCPNRSVALVLSRRRNAATVTERVETRSYHEVAYVHRDLIDTYQNDYSEYKKRVCPHKSSLTSSSTKGGKLKLLKFPTLVVCKA